MSLFERIKNKRYDLQEKKKFPGDESGAYKQAKDDLEARKGFKNNKPGGLKADEKNPFVKRSVRKARVDKLGGDIYDQPKFSQKGFEKSLKKVEKLAKTPKYKRQSYYRYPLTEPFGKGDTPGQIRVKGLETKAFKKTKPSDVKLPKSFTDFQKNLQDYKDRNKATMRTGKSSSKVKVSGANNLTRQDVGMAPPDTPKKTKPQKGVSATEITKKYNQKRAAKASKNTMPSGKDFINKYKKQAETATTNLRKKVDTIAKNPKLTGSEKALKSRSVMKDVKTAQNFARGYANPKTVQTAITVPKDIKTVQSAVKGAITKKGRTITKKFGVGATKYATKSGANIAFGKSPAGKIVKKIGLKPTYGTRKIATTLVKKGGLPAVVGLGLLSSPYARTAIKGALLGGGLSAFKNPKPKLAKLSSKKIVGSSVKLGQKIPTTLPKPK